MRHAAWFAGEASSVPLVRSWVAHELAGSPRRVVDDALLCVSELSANAVLHAGTRFRVEISDEPGVLRLGVHDDDDTIPTARHPEPTSRTGRGLAIVDAVGDRWGVTDEPHGKTVWCELPSPGPVATADPSR